MFKLYSHASLAIPAAACLALSVAGRAQAVQQTTTFFPVPHGFGYVADGVLFDDSPFIGRSVYEIRVYWDVVVADGFNAALIEGYASLPIFVGQNYLPSINLNGTDNGWSGSGTFNLRKTINLPNMKFGPAWTFFSHSALVPEGFDADILPASRIEIDYDAPPIPGDLDNDGDVDDADFGLIFAAFTGPNSGPAGNPAADLDNDGDVDDADFGLAFAAFTGPGAPVSVPEPATVALLVPALLLRRRR